MTPYETALRLTRRRGTTTSHPDFIAAYLAAETERTAGGVALRLSPHLGDRIHAELQRLETGLVAFGAAASAAARAAATLERAWDQAATITATRQETTA